MDPIKKAFSKIKEDITSLQRELLDIKETLAHIQTTPTQTPPQTHQQTDIQTQNQTDIAHNSTTGAQKAPNMTSSIGNKGVPTHKQTDTQTHQQTQEMPQNPIKKTISDFRQANEILSSLDSIKREIRLKFKRLTPQEMLVFSTLYALEEQKITEITYKILSNNLSLSESSIRDYINKLINKGIPIEKIRQNNKIIVLKTSQDLKNIANLATISQLREL